MVENFHHIKSGLHFYNSNKRGVCHITANLRGRGEVGRRPGSRPGAFWTPSSRAASDVAHQREDFWWILLFLVGGLGLSAQTVDLVDVRCGRLDAKGRALTFIPHHSNTNLQLRQEPDTSH